MRLRARALAALYGVAGTACLLSALFPISAQSPTQLAIAVGSGALAAAAALLLIDRELPSWAIGVALLLVTAATCLLTARAPTEGSAVLSALLLPWIGGYAACFLSRRAATFHLVAMSAAFAVALAAAPPVERGPRIWLMLMATAWVGSTVLGRATERLAAMAATDPLTAVPNRLGLEEAAARAAATAGRRGEPLTVAMLDLDGFKRVNDTYGHARGDALLIEVTRSWRECLRGGDVLARLGGDEFVLLLPEADAPAAAQLLARMRAASPASFSAGVAGWLPDDDLDSVLHRADASLLEEKRRLQAARAEDELGLAGGVSVRRRGEPARPGGGFEPSGGAGSAYSPV